MNCLLVFVDPLPPKTITEASGYNIFSSRMYYLVDMLLRCFCEVIMFESLKDPTRYQLIWLGKEGS